MIVRRLAPDDLEVFRDLRLTSLRTDPDNFASDYDVWEAYSDQKWASYLDEESVFSAFDGDAPVGLIGLIPQLKSRLNHRTELAMVYVKPDHRGTGVADAMLSHVIAFARDAGLLQIELSVNAANARAIQFYGRHGFAAYGRLPRGFRADDGFNDDLLMVLKLD